MKKYSEKEWYDYVEDIVKNTNLINDKNKIKNNIEKNLVNDIKNIKERFGILFSGGIDSTLLALISKKVGKDFVCYTVGVSGSRDLDLVMDIAKKYDLNIRIKIINVHDVEGIVKDVIDIIKNNDIENINKNNKNNKNKINNNNNINPISVGVGCVVYSGMMLAKEDKIRTVVTGMGADELFAGYKEFLDVKDINEHCVYRLKNIYNDLNRDVSIGNKLKIKLMIPYLNDNIIKDAMQTPIKFKIKNNIRKFIIRELALDAGLDKKYAFIGKRAAQYSSGFDKAIGKLAKKQGFGNKKQYLNSF